MPGRLLMPGHLLKYYLSQKGGWAFIRGIASGIDKKLQKPQFSYLFPLFWLPEEEVWTSDTKVIHVLAPNSSSAGEPTCILVAVC